MNRQEYEKRLDKEDYLKSRLVWIDFIESNSMYVSSPIWQSCYSLKQPLTLYTGHYLYSYDMMELLKELGFPTKQQGYDGYPLAKAKISSKFKKAVINRKVEYLK